jgi:hypothetical protein
MDGVPLLTHRQGRLDIVRTSTAAISSGSSDIQVEMLRRAPVSGDQIQMQEIVTGEKCECLGHWISREVLPWRGQAKKLLWRIP